MYSEAVNAGATLAMDLEVEVETTLEEMVTNTVTVSGGGVAPASTSKPLTMPNTVEGPPAVFGIGTFGMAAHDMSGRLDTQAADHPYGLTTTLAVNTDIERRPNGAYDPVSVEPPKDFAVYLPLGLIGDPAAAAKCTQVQLIGKIGGETETECPPSSRVGSVVLLSENSVNGSVNPEASGVSAIYNMVPEEGYPAQLGLKVLGKAVSLYANVVHTLAGYALRVATPGIPRAINVEGIAITFFGDPRTANGEPGSPQAFFTNPADCTAGPLKARIEADSWAEPGHWYSTPEEPVVYPHISGCDLLAFEPEIALRPEVTQTEEPTGYEIKVKLPQSPNRFPILATPDLKDVTMTLPAGMTISPGGGSGLTGCEATGPNGIDMPSNAAGERHPNEAGEGEAIGPDGMAHLVAGHCPQSSQVGTVEITTPVLESPLTGHVYVAQPECGGTNQRECTTADAADGSLFGIYLEAQGSGAVVKLKGSVAVNPTTGQITAQFLNNPQLPVSEVVLHMKGGGRAPLVNPRQCGAATAVADLTPWSSPMTPDAIREAPFTVDWDGNGAPCPAALPFAPALEAGSTSTLAERFTPFTLTLRRGDHQQDLGRVQVKLPAGLLGMLSKVALCEEPQAALGTCSEASRIGTVNVAAGPGPQPLWVQGRVYLTGPYAGAPFGISVVVGAVAGPFNLGNVVVRGRIDVDPNTAQVTVTSDAPPPFKDGIPLRIEALNVAVERPGFTFNPTNCGAKQVEATLESQQGAKAVATTPFAVEGCRSLPFKPTFKVSTEAKTSKAKGASLKVRVTSAFGQDNIGGVVARLPKALPARLTTLQQACGEAVFAQNPALCPTASNVGYAKAITPVLNTPVTGPVYLVSHGGAAFPDVVVILQGEGVRLDLTGNTSIAKGITTSTFAAVPDAPVSSFELTLPEGAHSALASNLPAKAKRSFCSTKLVMPTTLRAQDGVRIAQSTAIAVVGCPKAKPRKKVKRKRKK